MMTQLLNNTRKSMSTLIRSPVGTECEPKLKPT